MQESGKTTWQLKKAYEIAYAAFRIAAKMKEQDFGANIKSAAMGILGAVAADEYAVARKRLTSLEYLIRFAMDVSIMGIVNGDIMLREMAGLDEALIGAGIGAEVRESGEFAVRDEADIAGIFSEVDSVEPVAIRQNISSGKNGESGKRNQSGNPGNGESANGEIGGILKSAIRQSAILERIRQIGNCRIRDIQEILPDSSERTIRYDLQTMLEQGVIERVGSGGPAVYYKVRPETV